MPDDAIYHPRKSVPGNSQVASLSAITPHIAEFSADALHPLSV